MVACVGLNGAGKSTMLHLLCRLWDPNTGSIEIDGQNIAKVTMSSLRHNIYLLSQNSPKLGKTVRENLHYCLLEATTTQVEEACREVGLYDKMDESDTQLSGGELQQLAIARALLRNPNILLLDEPTSALNPKAEQSFRRSTLENLRKGRTLFIVAHRLKNTQHADLILVFKEGRIVQQGTHDELVQQTGLYNELWEAEQG